MFLIRHLGLSHMAIAYAGNQGQAGVGFGDSGSPTSPWLTQDLGLRTGAIQVSIRVQIPTHRHLFMHLAESWKCSKRKSIQRSI
jgi:hypothetical protein